MQPSQQIEEAMRSLAPDEYVFGEDGEDGEPAEFSRPVEALPIFNQALAYFQDHAPGHAVQIDTQETYAAMIGAGDFAPVDGVADGAKDIKCYHDGDCVFVSILFALPDGSQRIATSAARSIHDEAFRGWQEVLDGDPVAFLAMYPEAARVATGKRLLSSAADAVDAALGRSDIIGMTRPVIVREASEKTAPLAALMYLEQRAQKGDRQAQVELAIMRGAAETPLGQKIAAPLLKLASEKLAEAQAMRRSA